MLVRHLKINSSDADCIIMSTNKYNAFVFTIIPIICTKDVNNGQFIQFRTNRTCYPQNWDSNPGTHLEVISSLLTHNPYFYDVSMAPLSIANNGHCISYFG